MKIVRERPSRVVALILCAFAYLLYSIYFVKWPEVFLFNSKIDGSLFSRLIHSDVHLDDDVMISLRVGSILRETGIPAFNRSDLAQPSTSYLAPYFFALLEGLLPNNIAVAMYATLTFLGISFLLLFIFVNSKSRAIGTVSIILIISTDTFKGYSLMGWDHNLQSVFICLAIWLVLKENITWRYAFLIGITLFLSVGFRPDSGILAISVLWSLFLKNRTLKSSVLSVGFFVIPLSTLLYLNWIVFNHFTPTTSRLKLGGGFSINDSFAYLIGELLAFTTLNLCFLALLIYGFLGRYLPIYLLPIFLGCLVTVVYSLAVTDVFPGARMTWTPALVMTLIITKFMPSPFKFWRVDWEFKSPRKTASRWQFMPLILSAIFLVLLPLAGEVKLSVAYKDSMIRAASASPTSAQYNIARIISKNFSPSDGAVGLYWLGIGYHLPRFEIADFLGKADEMIAQQTVKWGPPGHNKWDSEATVRKWNPQIIVSPRDDMNSYSLDEAKQWQEERRDWGFVADLRLNRTISRDYTNCKFQETISVGSEIAWHFYLRNDLVSRYSEILNCA